MLQPWSSGQRIKPQGVGALRLSRVARCLNCVGAVLFNEGITKPTVIGPGTRLGTLTATPTIAATEEGSAFDSGNSAAAVVSVNGTVSIAPPGSGSTASCSIVARLKGRNTSTSLVSTHAVSYGGTGSRGVGVAVLGTGVAQAGANGGNGAVGVSGSNTYIGTYVTVGVSIQSTATASTFPILYENGVNIATGGSAAGSMSNAALNSIAFGNNLVSPLNTKQWCGQCPWAFVFNKKLSDAEHQFVAQNPWALIELAMPPMFVGIISAASRPVKMAGEWNGFAGRSGGFAG